MISNTPDTRWLAICRLGTVEKRLMLKTRDGRLWVVRTNEGSAKGAWILVLALLIAVAVAVVIPGLPWVVAPVVLAFLILSGGLAGAVTVWWIRRAELPVLAAAEPVPTDPQFLKRCAAAGIRNARMLSVSLIVAALVLIAFSAIVTAGERDLRATFVVVVATYFIVVVAYLRPFASWRAASTLNGCRQHRTPRP